MIKRYDLEATLEYLALDKSGNIKKDPKTGKGIVEKSQLTHTNLEANDKKEAVAIYEARVKKNYGSRFVGIKTKVVRVGN